MKPAALKRGRNPRFPYVPVIQFNSATSQIRGVAFATRDEALAFAAQHIEKTEARHAAQMKAYDARHASRANRITRVVKDEAAIDAYLAKDAFQRGIICKIA